MCFRSLTLQLEQLRQGPKETTRPSSEKQPAEPALDQLQATVKVPLSSPMS